MTDADRQDDSEDEMEDATDDALDDGFEDPIDEATDDEPEEDVDDALDDPDLDDSYAADPDDIDEDADDHDISPEEQVLLDVGAFIRSQRERTEMSLRRLAELADVSNPYLSQVERGLRKPSAEILQQVAQALRISVESLYVRAGILPDTDRRVSTVPEAIEHDPYLSDEQKQALLGVYASFVDGV